MLNTTQLSSPIREHIASYLATPPSIPRPIGFPSSDIFRFQSPISTPFNPARHSLGYSPPMLRSPLNYGDTVDPSLFDYNPVHLSSPAWSPAHPRSPALSPAHPRILNRNAEEGQGKQVLWLLPPRPPVDAESSTSASLKRKRQSELSETDAEEDDTTFTSDLQQRSRTRIRLGNPHPPPPRRKTPPQSCPRGGVSFPNRVIINQSIPCAPENDEGADKSTPLTQPDVTTSRRPINRTPKTVRFKSFKNKEIPKLDTHTERLVVAIASHCETGRGGISLLEHMDDIVNTSQWEERAIAYADNTAACLALRCAQTVNANAASHLVSVICDIQLAAKVHRFVLSLLNVTNILIHYSLVVKHEYPHQQDVYYNHIAPTAKNFSLRAFNQHVTWGTQYALIAGAGSIHLLVLIVASQKRNDLRTILPDEFGGLCANIKDPRDNLVGRAFTQTIIPFLSQFRKRHRLKISTMLGRKIRRRMGRIPKELDVSDLEMSDKYYATIPSQ